MHYSTRPKRTIRSDKLERAVLEALRMQIALAVDMEKLISDFNQSGTKQHSSKRLTDERERLKQ